MKISRNWLQQYISFKNVSSDDLFAGITKHTAEAEELIFTAEKYKYVRVGRLLSYTTINEKLHAGVFDLGDLGQKNIVFGSVHPLQKRQQYPIALAGAQLANGIMIETTTIAGHTSEGMVCDNIELGMKNDGLLIFGASVKPGTPLADVDPAFDDTLIDIDNKSLTHRPDLMGHLGFVRELSAIYNKDGQQNTPTADLNETTKAFPLHIKTDRCRRFMALTAENVTVEASPLGEMITLEHLGTRAISNVVDITNWVLLLHGQPMHAFDADKIIGGITVRMAKEGETLIALDGEKYTLKRDDIVIADDEKVLSIAGIMGGLASGVTANTKSIVFECASFDPVSIRKTSQRLSLRSESSMRYEKDLCPEQCKMAINHAAFLLQQRCPDVQFTSAITDKFPHPTPEKKISLQPGKVRKITGMPLRDEEMKAYLESINFVIDTAWNVTIPANRATKDITIAEDLIEEIVRLHGLDKVPTTLPKMSVEAKPAHTIRQRQWQLRSGLSLLGYDETMLYSLTDEGEGKFTGNDDATRIRPKNPLSGEKSVLRQTLLYGINQSIESEVRTHGELHLFELGRVYQYKNDAAHEDETLCVVHAKMKGNSHEMMYQLRDDVLHLLQTMGHAAEVATSENSLLFAHPGQSADLLVNGQSIGTIAVLHPQFAVTKGVTVAFAQLNIASLSDVPLSKYQHLSTTPAMNRDLSIIIDESIEQQEITQTILAHANIQNTALFDIYRDSKKIGTGKKNMAFHITIKDAADETMTELVETLKATHGAVIRTT